MYACHEKLEKEGVILAYIEGEFSIQEEPNVVQASVSNIGTIAFLKML